jgi:GH24 family phage-related lysozyme (muramidase)
MRLLTKILIIIIIIYLTFRAMLKIKPLSFDSLRPLLMTYMSLWEGVRLTAYNDNPQDESKGKWTIGVGSTFINNKPVYKGQVIDLQTAMSELIDRMKNDYDNLPEFHGKLTASQWLSILSFAYSVGFNGFKSSLLYTYLVANRIYDATKISQLFMNWTTANGVKGKLITRRQNEIDMFNS